MIFLCCFSALQQDSFFWYSEKILCSFFALALIEAIYFVLTKGEKVKCKRRNGSNITDGSTFSAFLFETAAAGLCLYV